MIPVKEKIYFDDDRNKICNVINPGGIVNVSGAHFEDLKDPVSDVLSFFAVQQGIPPP